MVLYCFSKFESGGGGKTVKRVAVQIISVYLNKDLAGSRGWMTFTVKRLKQIFVIFFILFVVVLN